MNPILQVFYSVFSGLILGLAIPNDLYTLGCPYFTLFALVPLYLAVRNSKNYGFAFLSGFIQTCTTHLFSSFWLAHFKDFAALTLGGSAFGTALIGGFLCLLMYLPFSNAEHKNPLYVFSAKYTVFSSSTFKIFYFAGMYTLYEWCKSCGFLGYPWATISSTIYNWNILMQLASITGTYGITFILALLNGFSGEILILLFAGNSTLLSGKKVFHANKEFDLRISATTIGLLFLLAFIHGAYNYDKKISPQKTLRTIIVQKNSNPWTEKNDKDNILTSEKLSQEQIDLSRKEGINPELIVWSEGTLRSRYPDAEKRYQTIPTENPLITFIKHNRIPLLTGGAYTRDKKNKIYFNSAIMFDSDGNFRGVYGKNHLVPLAEAIPGMEYPKIKKFMAKVIGISNGWTPGDQYVFFDVPGRYTENHKIPTVKNVDITTSYKEQKRIDNEPPKIKIAAPICYDDAFPDIMGPLFKNGAELFVNLTDDSWSLKESSEYQHFVVASYRSIEYRTTMIRCTNAGYSVIIDPKGHVIADLPLFTEGAFTYDVPVYERTMTTYARFGNWLPWILFLLFLGYAIYSYFVFNEFDYIPSERKIKSGKNKTKNKSKKENSHEKIKGKKNKSDKKNKTNKKNKSDKSKKHHSK